MTDAGIRCARRADEGGDTDETTLRLVAAASTLARNAMFSGRIDGDIAILRTVLDQIPDQIYVKDRQSRFLFANRATLLANGATEQEQLLGKSDFEIGDRESAEGFYRVEQRIMDEAAAQFDIEESLRRGDQTKSWWLTTKIPLTDDQGRVIGLIGIARDITQRRREEAIRSGQSTLLEMIARNERLQTILKTLVLLVESQIDGLNASILLLDAEGERLHLGAAPNLPSAYNALIGGIAIGPMVGSCGSAAWLGKPVVVSDILQDRRWADYNGLAQLYGFRCCWSTPILTQQGNVLGTFALYGREPREPTAVEMDLVAMATHIAGIAIERQHAEDRMHFMAHHDPLTGLPNRSFFKEKLSQTLHQARMNRQHVVLAYVDLDNFKRINDSLGHGAGDELLRQIAGRMLEFTRASDLVVRLGGDEFVLVFANQSRGEGDILPRLHQLRASLSKPMTIAGMTVSATCSMGIATFPEDGETIDALLANADAAMYRAKQLGRDGLQVFNGKETPAAIAAGDRLEELRSAIAGDQLYLDYQPQIDAGTGRILGVEALVRWNHPELGVQPPGHFIPLAEATGLILPLGLWVLKTACRQNKAWQVLGLPPVIIAVNVSPRQFCDPALVGQVRQALSETGLDPRYLELELTENAVMQDTDSALATMRALEELGVRLSIDDFGTGYCNLAALKTLPVNRLKMDRSFIEALPHDATTSAIASAVIALAQKLKLGIIAEGVETAEQLQYLRNSGCDEVQGFHFSAPVDAGGIEALLRRAG